jgi:hypothetical protein
MTVLARLADVLRCVNNHTDAITRLNRSSFQAHNLDGGMIRVQTGQQTFYVELQPLRSFPVADITFEGVFIQPAVVFWPRWLISTGDAELAMVVKVEEAALNSASNSENPSTH